LAPPYYSQRAVFASPMSAFSFLIDVDGDDSDGDDDYDDDRVSQAQFVVLLQICVAYKKHTMST